jgi:hypothetical protein
MRASPLPERLLYLQPFRKKFARSGVEGLNEDSGSAVLWPLLSERIRGLSQQDAEKVLSDDFAALQLWLAEAARQNDPLQFVLGFSLVASPEDFVKRIKEEAEKPPEPQLCLHMDLPPGAKVRRVPGGTESGKLVTLRGLWLAIDALPEQAVANLYDAAVGNAHAENRSEQTVTFGSVAGRKLITRGEAWNGKFKEVAYRLTVPGGYVTASISAIGKRVDRSSWDESPFEACFHTLRVESKLPMTLS